MLMNKTFLGVQFEKIVCPWLSHIEILDIMIKLLKLSVKSMEATEKEFINL